MNLFLRVALLLLLGPLLPPATAAPTRFHHCRDAAGVSHYRSLPCDADQVAVGERTVDPPAEARRPEGRGQDTRRSAARRADPGASRRSSAPRAASPRAPSRAHASGGAAAGAEAKVCAAVRAGTYRASPDERLARSAYRRNLLRDRGC